MALLFPQHTFLELTKTSFVSSCQNSSIAVYSARSIGGRPCATIYNCPFRRLALGAARPRRRGDRMKRREFITLLTSATAASSLSCLRTGRAQPAGKVYRIGILE